MRILVLLALTACSTSPSVSDAGDAALVYKCPPKDAGGPCRDLDGAFSCTDPSKPYCVDGQCSSSYGWCASDPTLIEPCVTGEATCPLGICNVGDYCVMREGFKGTCQCSGP